MEDAGNRAEEMMQKASQPSLTIVPVEAACFHYYREMKAAWHMQACYTMYGHSAAYLYLQVAIAKQLFLSNSDVLFKQF